MNSLLCTPFWKLFGVLTPLVLVSAIPTLADEPPKDVVTFDHSTVERSFAQGLPITSNTHYKILAGRRVVPGNVEIHDHDTDIFHVVEGTATFVTGGTAVEAKASAPGEIRAKSIKGGEVHHLQKDDVIIIPKGTPHQFTEVNGTFLYFVVKVTE